jgi:hypothetical protein
MKRPPPLRNCLSGLAASLFFAALGVSPAQNLRQPPTPQQRAYAAKLGWGPAAGQLGESLRAGYQPGRGGSAGSVANSSFQAWLLLARWCELLARPAPQELTRYLGRFFYTDPASPRSGGLTFIGSGLAPANNFVPVSADRLKALSGDSEALHYVLPSDFVPGSGSVADGLSLPFLAAMAGNPAFLQSFFGSLSDLDYAPAVLKTLQQIWEAEPEKWVACQNLAIAIALVRDQPPPRWWPHSQVKPADVPKSTATPVEEFRFWVASNESHALYNDLRQLDVEDLKFVVDAPVATSELTWAQKNARFPRGDFGRAFSSIRYAYDRLTNQAYTWSGGPYTLAAIQATGGICVDQAYFAMLAGKARGLPTLFFTGQGTDGGHAWFGYLKGPGRWNMDCGRYENQNYAVGEALDPQTWLPINDHELASLAQSFRRTPAYLASQDDLAMARIFAAAGDPKGELAALDSAISTSPRNDLAWAAKEAFLDRTNAPVAAKRAFHEDAIRQFTNNDDLKVRHQRALAALSRADGDEAAAAAFESQIISQNRRERSDLSVDAAATRLFSLVKDGKSEDAMREYRGLLSRLGRTSGGNFFYQVVSPFARALAQSGDAAGARRVVDSARTALRPEAGSILDQDIAELETRFQAATGSGR